MDIFLHKYLKYKNKYLMFLKSQFGSANELKILFLGTASQKPSPTRNVTSSALILNSGRYLLFDCGENTQRQIMKSNIIFDNLHSIFITHLHGDHIYGLPGLLASLNKSRTNDLNIYGPIGIKTFVEQNKIYANIDKYKINYIELNASVINIPDENCKITPIQINHVPKVYCLGYVIQIIDKKITILGDTKNPNAIIPYAYDSDVLVHEATNALTSIDKDVTYEDVLKNTISHGHSTPQMAGEFAKKINAKKLILTHFSSRYSSDNISVMDEIKNQAIETFSCNNVICAKDFFEVSV